MKISLPGAYFGLGVLSTVFAQGPLMQAILPRYDLAKRNLIEAAEYMPASEYNFRLTPPQRSFAEWIDHNVLMNYNLCARVEGKASNPKKPASQSKDDLVAALKESFQYCDVVFQNMTDEKALKAAEAGSRSAPPVDAMLSLLVSWNQHYGNLVGYLRAKGIVPPTTARASGKK
ncbi:MAG: DinB family protein [Bryobacteraceae bacterium]|nr:DinB family protein [Bryobacteraceae bacterium]MDW8378737.1 DinB family protein [Bryobacterales bacterium]